MRPILPKPLIAILTFVSGFIFIRRFALVSVFVSSFKFQVSSFKLRSLSSAGDGSSGSGSNHTQHAGLPWAYEAAAQGIDVVTFYGGVSSRRCVPEASPTVGVARGPHAPVGQRTPCCGGPLGDAGGAEPVHEGVGWVGQVPRAPHTPLDGDEVVLLGHVGVDDGQLLPVQGKQHTEILRVTP